MELASLILANGKKITPYEHRIEHIEDNQYRITIKFNRDKHYKLNEFDECKVNLKDQREGKCCYSQDIKINGIECTVVIDFLI